MINSLIVISLDPLTTLHFKLYDTGAYGAMSGPTSLIRVHICNYLGDCCVAGPVTDLTGTEDNPWPVPANDPCFGMTLAKLGGALQVVEIEHEGPDGIDLAYLDLYMGGEQITCMDWNHPDGAIVLPGGAGERIELNCLLQIIFS